MEERREEGRSVLCSRHLISQGAKQAGRSSKPLTFLSNFLCFCASLFSAFSSLASSSPSSPPHTSYARWTIYKTWCISLRDISQSNIELRLRYTACSLLSSQQSGREMGWEFKTRRDWEKTRVSPLSCPCCSFCVYIQGNKHLLGPKRKDWLQAVYTISFH